MKTLENKELNTVGKRIKYARKQKGITIQALADSIGKQYQFVQQYESGQRNPKSDMIATLAKALDVSPLWLKNGGYTLTQDNKCLSINACIDNNVLKEYRKDYLYKLKGEIDGDEYEEIINLYKAELDYLVDRLDKTNNPELIKAGLEIFKLLMQYTDKTYNPNDSFEI